MKKIISTILLVILTFVQFSNITFASTEISKANITYDKDCGNHLQRLDGTWYTIVASYVEYTAPDGNKYPAYCLDNTKPGVGNSIIGDFPEGYEVNIDKLLDNDKVYRAIINGYPYKTPEELGVENKYDAYIATKQAIYSVLYNYDVENTYRGVDERGKKIHKALINIVKKAREGTETQKTAEITFEAQGSFKEDLNLYYSQEYKIKSNIPMDYYSITNINNLPNGSFIADESGNKKIEFKSKEKFKIMIPKESFNDLKKIEGSVFIKGKCENYPIFYGKKDSNVQPYALTYSKYGMNNYGELKLNIDNLNTGIIKVVKLEDETNIPIEGVKFRLKKEDGTFIQDVITDKEGIALFSNLYQGKYFLEEIETNKNYILNEEVFEVNVEYDKQVAINIVNETKKWKIKIVKVDSDNNNIKLQDVKIQLLDKKR